jgi:DNA-binding CsgD family transcriptional regulator
MRELRKSCIGTALTWFESPVRRITPGGRYSILPNEMGMGGSGDGGMATVALEFGDVALRETVEDRVARLTEGQRQCLMLVNQHRSSKEIALQLGISSHTVDQRIRQALQILGVERRGQAARLVAANDQPAYQRLIDQPPHSDLLAAPPHQHEAVGNQIRLADRAGKSSFDGIETEQIPADRWASLPMPFATRGQPTNEMSVVVRLLWIVLIAIGTTFSAGMYLAGLESLTRMMGG